MEIHLKPNFIIPFTVWGTYSFTIFACQLFQGTLPIFALYIFFFHVCMGITFNILGGLSSVEGWLITLFGLRHVVISQFMKVFFGQAADQGLKDPETTGLVYSIGMALVLSIAFLCSRFNIRFKNLIKPHSNSISNKLSWALYFGGIFCQTMVMFQYYFSIYLTPFINLLSYLQPLTFLGIAYELNKVLTRTEGKSFLSLGSGLMLGWSFIFGVLNASKLLMFEPVFVLLVTLVLNSYRVSLKEILLGFVTLLLMILVLTPLSNDGRSVYRKNSWKDTIPALKEYLEQNFSSIERYHEYKMHLESSSMSELGFEKYYYEKAFPLLDRFSLVHEADVLISAYNFREPEGFKFFWDRFYILPRSLTGKWLKDSELMGDALAKISGLIREENNGTAIAFGFFAESYAIGGLWGVIIFQLIVFTGYIIIIKSLELPYGDKIWLVFLIVYLQNVFSESGIIGLSFAIVRKFPLLFILKKTLEFLENTDLTRISKIYNFK